MRTLRHIAVLATCLLSSLPRDAAAEIDLSLEHVRKTAEAYSPGDPWERVADASQLAWGEAATLHMHLDLYALTQDVKYLEIIARRGERMLTHRDDHRGVADGSGKIRPAWSMADKYTVARAELKSPDGKTVIDVRSTPTSYNNETQLEIVNSKRHGRFTLKARNDFYQREERFDDLSMDRNDARFIETVVNNSKAPRAAEKGTAENQPSQLIRVNVVDAAAPPAPQQVALSPIPLAFMPYTGIIYQPLLEFASIVHQHEQLAALRPTADRFVRAARETFDDALARLWVDGPGEGEGYLLTCEKGESFAFDNVGAPFNYQGRLAASLLLVSDLTGDDVYREKALRIARMFKNRLEHDAKQNLYTWYYWFEPITTTGWTPEDSPSINIPWMAPAPYIEDVSHAVLDLAMVDAAHARGLVFDDEDLRRFANTLLRNVVVADRSTVNTRVDGTGGAADGYAAQLRGWLPLAKTDRAVFDAIRETYLTRGKEDVRFSAALLAWEKRLDITPSATQPAH